VAVQDGEGAQQRVRRGRRVQERSDEPWDDECRDRSFRRPQFDVVARFPNSRRRQLCPLLGSVDGRRSCQQLGLDSCPVGQGQPEVVTGQGAAQHASPRAPTPL